MKTKAAVQEAPEAARAEHARGPAVVRVAELVGVSAEGWDDAARRLVARASETVRHITGLDVIRRTAVVRDGRIAEYHLTAKLAFILEPTAVDPAGVREAAPPRPSTTAPDEFGLWGSASDIL